MYPFIQPEQACYPQQIAQDVTVQRKVSIFKLDCLNKTIENLGEIPLLLTSGVTASYGGSAFISA